MSQLRTPEQKSRKLLNEEMTILGLEMAIKKEQYRNGAKPTSVSPKAVLEKKDTPLESESNSKTSRPLNFLFKKLGF